MGMKDDFMFLPSQVLKKQIIEEVKNCNEFTLKYGVILSEQDIQSLMENRKEVLQNTGRIEFGGGILKKLVLEFADSPFIYQDNYVSTLMELQECFYYFKGEALDDVTDDELISYMKDYFNDECQGSVEYLKSTALENLSRDIRYHEKEYSSLTGYEDNYIDFYDGDLEYDD